jgi:hypothetical protein
MPTDGSNAYWMVSENHRSIPCAIRESPRKYGAKPSSQIHTRVDMFTNNSGYRTREPPVAMAAAPRGPQERQPSEHDGLEATGTASSPAGSGPAVAAVGSMTGVDPGAHICQGLAIHRPDDCSGWTGLRGKQFCYVAGAQLKIS